MLDYEMIYVELKTDRCLVLNHISSDSLERWTVDKFPAPEFTAKKKAQREFNFTSQ